MYIVRWLLANPIVATWVVLGVAAFFVISGIGDKEEETLASAKPTTENSVVEEIVTTDTETRTASEEEKNDDQAENVKTEISEEVKSDVVETNEVKTEEKVVETEDAKVETVVDAEKPSNTKESSVAEKAMSESTVPPLALEPTNVPPADTNSSEDAKPSEAASADKTAITDLNEVSNEEMLLMAREAYWNNGLDEAAQIYGELIEKEPSIYEHKGELGNVYWLQGYPEKAAELYSEIAIPMIDNGGSERVANMIGFIGLFYPDRASVIHERMQMKAQSKE